MIINVAISGLYFRPGLYSGFEIAWIQQKTVEFVGQTWYT